MPCTMQVSLLLAIAVAAANLAVSDARNWLPPAAAWGPSASPSLTAEIGYQPSTPPRKKKKRRVADTAAAAASRNETAVVRSQTTARGDDGSNATAPGATAAQPTIVLSKIETRTTVRRRVKKLKRVRSVRTPTTLQDDDSDNDNAGDTSFSTASDKLHKLPEYAHDMQLRDHTDTTEKVRDDAINLPNTEQSAKDALPSSTVSRAFFARNQQSRQSQTRMPDKVSTPLATRNKWFARTTTASKDKARIEPTKRLETADIVSNQSMVASRREPASPFDRTGADIKPDKLDTRRLDTRMLDTPHDTTVSRPDNVFARRDTARNSPPHQQSQDYMLPQKKSLSRQLPFVPPNKDLDDNDSPVYLDEPVKKKKRVRKVKKRTRANVSESTEINVDTHVDAPRIEADVTRRIDHDRLPSTDNLNLSESTERPIHKRKKVKKRQKVAASSIDDKQESSAESTEISKGDLPDDSLPLIQPETTDDRPLKKRKKIKRTQKVAVVKKEMDKESSVDDVEDDDTVESDTNDKPPPIASIDIPTIPVTPVTVKAKKKKKKVKKHRIESSVEQAKEDEIQPPKSSPLDMLVAEKVTLESTAKTSELPTVSLSAPSKKVKRKKKKKVVRVVEVDVTGDTVEQEATDESILQHNVTDQGRNKSRPTPLGRDSSVSSSLVDDDTEIAVLTSSNTSRSSVQPEPSLTDGAQEESSSDDSSSSESDIDTDTEAVISDELRETVALGDSVESISDETKPNADEEATATEAKDTSADTAAIATSVFPTNTTSVGVQKFITDSDDVLGANVSAIIISSSLETASSVENLTEQLLLDTTNKDTGKPGLSIISDDVIQEASSDDDSDDDAFDNLEVEPDEAAVVLKSTSIAGIDADKETATDSDTDSEEDSDNTTDADSAAEESDNDDSSDSEDSDGSEIEPDVESTSPIDAGDSDSSSEQDEARTAETEKPESTPASQGSLSGKVDRRRDVMVFKSTIVDDEDDAEDDDTVAANDSNTSEDEEDVAGVEKAKVKTKDDDSTDDEDNKGSVDSSDDEDDDDTTDDDDEALDKDVRSNDNSDDESDDEQSDKSHNDDASVQAVASLQSESSSDNVTVVVETTTEETIVEQVVSETSDTDGNSAASEDDKSTKVDKRHEPDDQIVDGKDRSVAVVTESVEQKGEDEEDSDEELLSKAYQQVQVQIW
jgi:hypothetical protein